MFQQQSFHTANYKGNQPGHDQSWRSDSTQPSQVQSSRSAAAQPGQMGGASQYGGYQKSFQPTGYVQSVYGAGQQQSKSRSAYTAAQSPQSFHTASYKGNQPGHDQSWRSDSSQPSQMQSWRAQPSQMQPWKAQPSQIQSWSATQPRQTGISGAFGTSSISGYGKQAQAQAQSPQSFHTASYKGNQPGHDQSWRSDSSQPSQMGGGSSYAMASGTSFGMSAGGQSQFQSPQSFHTASYKGNQPGHDQSWRSDSTQPSSFSSALGSR